MNQAQAILIWAIAFAAFERSRPAHLAEVPYIHPAEVLSGGLITVADFLGYMMPGQITHIQCCGTLVPYPTASYSTFCCGCGSEFTTRIRPRKAPA